MTARERHQATTDYAPGTVAMVTYRGERVRAFRVSRNYWAVTGGATDSGTYVSDITPLVCIEATREDTDEIEKCFDCGMVNNTNSVHVRLRDAIREQTPEPLVIPENLGAVVEDRDGKRYTCSRIGDDAGDFGSVWHRSDEALITYGIGWLEQEAARVLSEGVTP